MGTSSSTIRQPGTRHAVVRNRRMTELRLPPMFYVKFEDREAPPKLTANDLPEPQKFHERLAAWLMKQH